MTIKPLLLCVFALMIFQAHAQEKEEVVDFSRIRWLAGSWVGVGFENAGKGSKVPVRQQEFTLTYNPDSLWLIFKGGSQNLSSHLKDEQQDYLHIDKEGNLSFYFAGDFKFYNRNLIIERVSEDNFTLSLTYNRQPMKEKFIAHAAFTRKVK